MADRSSTVGASERIVEYLETESIDAAPPKARTEARRRIIDTLGAITAGHQFEDIERAKAMLETTFAGGSVTVLDGGGGSLNGPGATLINTLAANELDVDDGNRLAEGHPAAVVLPAAIAAVEEQGGTIGDLLDAFLPAYEIAVRTSMAMHEWIGMHTGSGSWGAVGAAAAVAKTWELDSETAVDALGIAEFNAPITPVMRSVARPAGSFTKDGIGWGGFVGYMAASLAQEGFGGSGTLYDEIEHEGLDPSYLDSLGDRYHILEGYYKPYPACRWTHPGIDAVAELAGEYDLDPAAIEAVRVYTHPKGAELGETRPQTASEAEYSYPFIIAQAIRNGGSIRPADLQRAARDNPETLALADMISLHVDPEAADRYPEESLARVEIDVGAGSGEASETIESDLVNPRGSNEQPMSEVEQAAKWETLIDEYLGAGTTAQLLDRIEADDEPIEYLLEPWR